MQFITRFCFYSLLLVSLGSGLLCGAQTNSDSAFWVKVDSVELRYGRSLCDTLPELADSIFEVLKTKKFELLKPYLPTAPMLQEEFDSMDLARLQRLATVKQQYWEQNLRKQHIKLLKDAKVMHFSLRNMELVKRRIVTKELDSGVRVGEITYLCQSGKHKVYITFLAMEIVGRWFIGDELRIRSV
ncbi:MAG: hypothetical protein ACI8SE_002133 [Bacteroidia bacterium]|jgi:hypothetical protein